MGAHELLSNQITALITEITQIETERDRIQKQLDEKGMFPLSSQPSAFVERYKPVLETVERLNQTIDSKRQKLISLELLMLDESIFHMQLATGQVDSSVKSLETTTDKLLKSSTKLERLTTLLIYITILLAIIAIYQVSLALGASNPVYGAIGAFASLTALFYFMYRVYQAEKRGDITPLHRSH